MTIRIYDNRIDFGNYSLIIDNTGLSVKSSSTNATGTLTAVSCDELNFSFQGTVAGFMSGGRTPTGVDNTIDRFPFSNASTNAYDVGDLTVARNFNSTQSSGTHGYAAGGYNPPITTFYNTIDKFPFSINGNATDVGDLTESKYGSAGQSSNVAGYNSTGITAPGLTSNRDKFPFAFDTNATDVGQVNLSRYYAVGHSSGTFGYTTGGLIPSVSTNIEKFSFASDAGVESVGVLTSSTANIMAAGISSQHHGYITGGGFPGTNSSVIQRFPFPTNRNTFGIGNLTVGRYGATGVSSTTAGYTIGGAINPTTAQNIIERFPFATADGSYISTDVGDLSLARYEGNGNQD